MTYLKNLSPRDRRVGLIGAAIVMALLAFSYVLLPLQRAHARLKISVPEKRLALAEMRAQALQISARAPTVVAKLPISGSLLSFIDAQARQAGLAETLKRLEPVGDDAVRLTFERVEFERLARFLDQLNQSYGVSLSELSVTADVSPGQVSGQLKLDRSKVGSAL